jgi:hypothetical protein
MVRERSADDAWRTVARSTRRPHSGTGNALSWSPDGQFLAHTTARTATVLDSKLSVRHQEALPYPSDAHFSPSGELVTFGDWSAGLVLVWPPRADA